MRAAFCLGICLAVVLGVVSAEYPKTWISLFQPPYELCPEIMMSIGCVSADSCYVPGGSNGVGFGVYQFDGTMNGNFNPVKDIDNSPIDFLLQVGVGGTKEKPQGAVGGAGFLFPLKYFVNASALAPALTSPFSETMDIRTDRSGQKVLLIDGMADNGWGALYSTDAGVTYSTITVSKGTVPDTNCTIPNYVVIADTNTWYVVASSQPPSNNSGSGSSSNNNEQTKERYHPRRDKNLIYHKPHIALLRKGADLGEVLAAGFEQGRRATQRVRKSPLKAFRDWLGAGSPKIGADSTCGYGSSILKTTDGGSTWTNFNFNVDTWSLTDIDCVNATHCVSVGSGINASVIVRTVDGSTWTIVSTFPGSPTEFVALNAVRYNPANTEEIWVGGGLQSSGGDQAVFYVSKDGGATFNQDAVVNFIAEVMQISFAPDGTGFAVGISQFQDSTIMRYTYNGAPVTMAPVWNGNFSQVQCADNNCSVNCSVFSFPQNTCLNLTGGGSAVGICDMVDQILVQQNFPLDDVCFGPAVAEPTPLNLCFENQGGGSFYTVCGPVTTPPQSTAPHGTGKAMRRKGKHSKA